MAGVKLLYSEETSLLTGTGLLGTQVYMCVHQQEEKHLHKSIITTVYEYFTTGPANV